jgi:hypothetical protein
LDIFDVKGYVNAVLAAPDSKAHLDLINVSIQIENVVRFLRDIGFNRSSHCQSINLFMSNFARFVLMRLGAGTEETPRVVSCN